MEVEDKSVLVSGKNQAAAASSATIHVATPGLGEGRSTRPMVKRVMSGVMDGKFYKREHVHRSSQRLHPEIMTKKLESYSRNLKVRRAVKVGKRNHVAVTRTKRQHAEMESTDSGSSEGSSSVLIFDFFFPCLLCALVDAAAVREHPMIVEEGWLDGVEECGYPSVRIRGPP